MRPATLALLLLLGIANACSDASSQDAQAKGDGTSGSTATAKGADQAQATPPAKAAAPRRPRHERPLPAWQGPTLAGARLDLSELLGRRVLLFFFNPEVAEAAPVAEALARIEPLAGEHNFQIVGVALDGDDEAIRAFLDAQGLSARTLLDRQASLAGRIGLRSPVAAVVVDAEGYMVRGSARFASEGPDPVAAAEDMLREWLRLPPAQAAQIAMFGERPPAPRFETERLGGGAFELEALRGRPAVLVFFLHTCPHCHHALRFFGEALDALPEAKRPALVGISVANRPLAVREMLAQEDLDFFPVLMDPDGSIRQRYGATRGVPVVFLLDAQGRIVSRTDGWREERDPALSRMRLARLAGEPIPMLLHKSGYSGNDVCAVCHEGQAASWELTTHATAFDTLVRHGADRDPECVSCHVVGFGEPQGWSFEQAEPALEGVGCESCHGRGGPHLSPGFVTGHDYAPACQGCHNPEHSLGFDYAEFLPRVSHAANAELAALSLAEKRRILRERREPRDVLASDAEFVGSQACASCHPAEHETWSRQPHARAVASLATKGQQDDPACLACHTTGFGEPGGFPADAPPSRHPDLAAVGCESCHGPGSEHVPPEARKQGTIVSLGDKCDSCVILQICGSCHDDANDPGFEYEVQEKIEAQRHGTLAPAEDRAGSGAATEATRQALRDASFAHRRIGGGARSASQ